MTNIILNPEHIRKQINTLSNRIFERFPEAGLFKVSQMLIEISEHTKIETVTIERYIKILHVVISLILITIMFLIWNFLRNFLPAEQAFSLVDSVTLIDAGINDLVFLGIFTVFLISMGSRIQRNRALKAIRELRAIAHIIDMHQLTKDPEWVLKWGQLKKTASMEIKNFNTL